MDRIDYFEADGEVFESSCHKNEFCPRCYRIFKRYLRTVTIDLTSEDESIPSTPPTQISLE